MSRHTFGGTTADFVIRTSVGGAVTIVGGTSVNFYSAATAGTHYTDLLNNAGSAATSITAETDGSIKEFSGPDAVTVMWADAGGARRVKVCATDPSTTYQPVDHTWTAGLAVLSGQIIEHSGTLYKATASFTLPGSFNTTNLLSVGGGGGASTLPALIRTASAAYAATVTPNADTTDVLNVGTLTGNLTLAAPTGTPVDGQKLTVRLVQDATGGRVITFNAAYAFGSDITTVLVPTAALAKWEMLFTWNATDSKWRAEAIARGF